MVPSSIAVAPRKTVKPADLRGGTAETFNMFRRASAVLSPSHRRPGATAVIVRHKPQWHRHDRRGSAVVPSLIAVAPPKTVKTADLRGGMAETLNMFKTSAVPRGIKPPCNRGKVDWLNYGDPVAVLLWYCVTGRGKTMKDYWRCHYGDGGFDQKP